MKTEVIRKHAVLVYRNPTNNNGYADEFTKIYCTCGFIGELDMEAKDVCPTCSNDEFVRVSLNEKDAKVMLNAVSLYYGDLQQPENRHKITISFRWGEYYYNMKVGKLTFRNTGCKYVFNTITGNTYWVKGRTAIINATYGGMAITKQATFHSALARASEEMTAEYNTKMMQWAQLCADARGLHNIDVYALLNTYGGMFNGLANFTTLLRFPILKDLPFHTWSDMPKAMRKFLGTSPSIKQVWQYIAGSSSQGTRQWITGVTRLYMFSKWSRVIKKPDNLMKLLNGQMKAWEDDFLGFDNPTAYDNQSAGSQLMDIIENANERAKAHEWLMSLHADEGHYVRCLLKCRRPSALLREQRPVIYDTLDLRWVSGIVVDIHRLAMTISQVVRDEPYEFNYRNDIFRFHEALARDLGRMEHENKIIPITEQEEKWELTIGDYKFVLARDTYTLVDIGARMDHCVGGYGNMAVAKQTTIVTMQVADEPFFCISLSPKYNKHGYQLDQCKKYNNQFGTQKELEPVKEWLTKIGIKDWESSYDMNAMRGGRDFENDDMLVNAYDNGPDNDLPWF